MVDPKPVDIRFIFESEPCDWDIINANCQGFYELGSVYQSNKFKASWTSVTEQQSFKKIQENIQLSQWKSGKMVSEKKTGLSQS